MFEPITNQFKYRDKPKPVRHALLTLDHKWMYFLRLHDIATKLERGASHEDRKKATREFRQLRRFENREQLFASTGKLDSKIRDVLPLLDASSRRQLQKHMQELKALEGSVLRETAEQLKPLLEVNEESIDWKSVHDLAIKIRTQLAAIVAVEQTLKSIVKERSSTALQPALAR